MLSKPWLLTLLSLTTASLPCWAQPAPPPTPTQPSLVASQRLVKGSAAPFSGTLLSDAALAKIITDAEARVKAAALEADRLKKELDIAERKADAVCLARLDGERLRYAACSKDADRTRELLDKASNPPWYKNPYLHFIMGSVVSGGVCAAATRIK